MTNTTAADLVLSPETGPIGPVWGDKTRKGAIVAVLFVGLVLGGLFLLRPRPSGLARTRTAMLDNKHFVNGPAAGTTFANASQWLLQDGEACQHQRGIAEPRCRIRMSASAYSGVAAFIVVKCTAPGVYRARTALLGYLRAIDAFDRAPLGTAPVPSLPVLPSC